LYISICGPRNGDHFTETALIRQVLGYPVEIECVFVSSHYCTIGGEVEVEPVIKGVGDSSNGQICILES
jgi:hypothetical protein